MNTELISAKIHFNNSIFLTVTVVAEARINECAGSVEDEYDIAIDDRTPKFDGVIQTFFSSDSLFAALCCNYETYDDEGLEKRSPHHYNSKTNWTVPAKLAAAAIKSTIAVVSRTTENERSSLGVLKQLFS